MKHATTCRIGLALAIAAALGLAAAAACAEESPPAAPATVAPAPQGDAKTPESPPAEGKPSEATPPKPFAKKFLTDEEVRRLPVFTRLDDDSLQEILKKGKTLLGDVKDNTFGYDEEAFYWLLHLVSRLNPELLKPDAEALPYSALLAMPSMYRGEPVTLSGVYRSYEKHRVPSIALQKDIPCIYPCVISATDQPQILATVIVLEDPSANLRVDDDVVVKGYFYKVRQYQSIGGDKRFAPMIIAQRLVPTAEAGAAEEPAAGDRPKGGFFSDPGLMIGAGIVAVLLGVFITLRLFIRKPKQDGTDPRKPKVHKFRLHRQDRSSTPAGGGTGGAGGGPKP